MINKAVLPVLARKESRRPASKQEVLLVLLAAFAPLLLIGLYGEQLGGATTLGGIVVSLAYVISVGLTTLVLKRRGRGWGEIGLAWPESWRRTLLLGLGATVATIAGFVATQIVLSNLPGAALGASDQSQYNPLTGNLPLLLGMVTAAWTTVAFGEEMLFRAVLINSLAQLMPNARFRWLAALAGSSLCFGLAHYDWGPAGILDTAIMGLILGAIYLRTGRNLWVTIFAHGLLNTVKFISVFYGAG